MTAENLTPQTAVKHERSLIGLVHQHQNHLLGIAATGFLRAWNNKVHRLEVNIENAPQTGPALFLFNHAGMIDFQILRDVDPYSPATAFPIKKEVTDVPMIGSAIKHLNAITVKRDGRDKEAHDEMLNILEQEGTVCVAIEGSRSRSGHMEGLDQAALAMTLEAVGMGTPVYTITITGGYETMPPGLPFPIPFRKMKVTVGKQLVKLNELMGTGYKELPEREKLKLILKNMEKAAEIIHASFNEVLPEKNRFLESGKHIRRKSEYVRKH